MSLYDDDNNNSNLDNLFIIVLQGTRHVHFHVELQDYFCYPEIPIK